MPLANNQGVCIHYEVEGHGEQTLMLQHGFAATLWTWRDFGYVKELGKEYQLILIDARGHGKSDKPHDPEAYRAEIVARDYTAILGDLGIEKAHYLGYSMGGRIGLSCLARCAPNRFYSLTLGGVSPVRVRKPGERRPTDDFGRMLEVAAEKGMEVWLTYREKMVGTLTPAQKARQLTNDPRALLTMREAFSRWTGAEDILPQITIPCLFFVGEADPNYTGAEEAVRNMPGATFASIPGMNHDQALMRSDLVLPHVKRFLSEVSKKIKE